MMCDSSVNKKPIYYFLLVINSNWPSILHHFQVTADYIKILAIDSRALHFNALAGGDPLRISP